MANPSITDGTRVVAGALALFLIARASAFAVPFHGANEAGLRLSWTAVPERIETCRVLSAEELAQVEEHMRQRVQCEGKSATYLLKVEVDGNSLHEQVVRGGGLRHDRPLHLLREVDVPAGDHQIRISFTRREKSADSLQNSTQADATDYGVNYAASEAAAAQAQVQSDTGRFAGRAERELEERERRTRGAIPALLVLDTAMHFAPREVKIISFNRDQRVLKVLDKGSSSN